MVHEPRLLLPHHVRRIDGLPVTSPDRTIFDLAGARRIHPLRVERALDTAWAQGLVRWRTLDVTLHELAQKGRPGIRLMRALLDVRGPDHCPPESNLEARLADLLRAAGIAGFDRQVDLGGDDWIGRVDFVHRALRIVVEVDHSRWHGSLSDSANDARRDARLRAAGWLVIRVSEFDVWHRKHAVIAAIQAAVAACHTTPAA